jgi:hypothetical protein
MKASARKMECIKNTLLNAILHDSPEIYEVAIQTNGVRESGYWEDLDMGYKEANWWEDGMTDYLIDAAKHGSLRLIKHIVEEERAGDLNEDILAAAMLAGHLDVVKYIVENGIEVYDLSYEFRQVVEREDMLMVQLLIEAGADIKFIDDVILCMASKHGCLDIIKALIPRDFMDSPWNKRIISKHIRKIGDIALYLAAIYGHQDVVQFFIELGMETNMPRALHAALDNDRIHIAKYLMKHAPDGSPLSSMPEHKLLRSLACFIDEDAAELGRSGLKPDIIVYKPDVIILRRTITQRDFDTILIMLSYSCPIIGWRLEYYVAEFSIGDGYDDYYLWNAAKDGCKSLIEYLKTAGSCIHSAIMRKPPAARDPPTIKRIFIYNECYCVE